VSRRRTKDVPPPAAAPSSPAAPTWGLPSVSRPPGRSIGAPTALPPGGPGIARTTPTHAVPPPPAPPHVEPAPLPVAPPPPPAAAPPAPAPSTQWPGYAPPPPPVEAFDSSSNAANAYAEARRVKSDFEWKRAKSIPQGDSLLVHAWSFAVTCYPPAGMTVTLRRIDPLDQGYEFYIPGDALISDWPERKIYDECNRRRQQPWLGERFSARIRALSPQGETLELAGGEISFPADPSRSRTVTNPTPPPGPYGYPPPYPPPYGQPYGPASYGPAYGAPTPYGVPPPYGYPSYPYASPAAALPPWVPSAPWGAPPPWYGQGQQPPAKVAGDPELLAMWRSNQEMMAADRKDARDTARTMTDKLLDLALAKIETPPAEKEDSFATLERAITLADHIRGPAPDPSERRGITIHNVDGAKLVETKNGDLDVGASGVLSIIGDAKDFLRTRSAAVKASQSPGVNVSRPPPARVNGVLPPPRSNGTNGTHS
jgi:hypothetical protein